jgi:hypothetical protein
MTALSDELLDMLLSGRTLVVALSVHPLASNGDMSFVAVLRTRVFAKFLLRCGDVVVGIPQAEAHMDPCITLQGAFEAFNGTVGLGRRLTETGIQGG